MEEGMVCEKQKLAGITADHLKAVDSARSELRVRRWIIRPTPVRWNINWRS